MKQDKKRGTPVLLILLVLLLLIAGYYPFAYRPISQKLSRLDEKSKAIKEELFTLELAQSDMNTLRGDIQGLRDDIDEKEKRTETSLTATLLPDDINKAVKKSRIAPTDLVIEKPVAVTLSAEGEDGKPVALTDFTIAFSAPYDRTIDFLEYLEADSKGVYIIRSVKSEELLTHEISWEVAGSLYYYSDRPIAGAEAIEGSGEESKKVEDGSELPAE